MELDQVLYFDFVPVNLYLWWQMFTVPFTESTIFAVRVMTGTCIVFMFHVFSVIASQQKCSWRIETWGERWNTLTLLTPVLMIAVASVARWRLLHSGKEFHLWSSHPHLNMYIAKVRFITVNKAIWHADILLNYLTTPCVILKRVLCF
mgnify:FL=1